MVAGADPGTEDAHHFSLQPEGRPRRIFSSLNPFASASACAFTIIEAGRA